MDTYGEIKRKIRAMAAGKALVYEGSFTGWLVPYVEPTCRVELRDAQYPEKQGTYYVLGTEIGFGPDGGKRKISLGRRLG